MWFSQHIYDQMDKIFKNNSSNKVNFITSLFKKYQSKLSSTEQIVLLNIWINSCVASEEFEMAAVLLKEKKFIEENFDSVPQRKDGVLKSEDLMIDNPLFKEYLHHKKNPIIEKFEKPGIYKRIINKIKRFFKWQKK